MKVYNQQLRLYGITDQRWLKVENLEEAVKETLQSGTTIIQLREKELSDEDFEALALKIQPICHSFHVPFIINDNVDLAIKIHADGVHIGQDTSVSETRKKIGPHMILGATAHNLKEALKAQKDGADYLGVGAIHPTHTKSDTVPLSLEELKEITSQVTIPVVAIGGLNADNIHELKNCGIAGVAISSGIFSSDHIKEDTMALKKEIEQVISFKRPAALTIAGSDSSGGAGMQADIKTMISNGVYAVSAITALTAQNTTGVTGVYEVTPEFLVQQLDAIFTDIYPDAVKIGMVSSSALIDVIVERLQFYKARNIVVDPVMVATSGAKLISDEAIVTLKTKLLPVADVITPNIPEAQVLSPVHITSKETMIEAAKYIYEHYHVAVLLKGGHSINDANDLLYSEEGIHWFEGKRIYNDNTHGTGCTLSSAIASNLAKGYPLVDSVQQAKDYISDALESMLDLGNGSGPLDHGFDGVEKYK